MKISTRFSGYSQIDTMLQQLVTPAAATTTPGEQLSRRLDGTGEPVGLKLPVGPGIRAS